LSKKMVSNVQRFMSDYVEWQDALYRQRMTVGVRPEWYLAHPIPKAENYGLVRRAIP